MGVLLTTGCNLNCRHCADLIPYRQIYHYNKEDVINDLERILLSVRKIKEVLLIGGEVTLYKDLAEITKWCILQSKIEKIIITTNGTIMPSKEIWEILQNPKVTLRISGYGKNVARDRQLIVDEAGRRGIKCENLDGMIWRDIGSNRKRNRSHNELKDMFQSCTMRYCVGLTHDGNIFFCSRQVAAYYTSDYPIPLESEYLNVRNYTPHELKRKWKEFYGQKHISTCDYCDGITSDSEIVGTALQIVPKKKFIELLKIVISYNHKAIIDIKKLGEILGSVRDSLVDVKEFSELEDKIKMNISDINYAEYYKYLIELLRQISIDYRIKLCYLDGGGYIPKRYIIWRQKHTANPCFKFSYGSR